MFKKGVITDEISQDLGIALEVAVRYGLDAIELRSVWDKSVHELDDGEIDKIKKLLQDTGLHVCAISSQFFKCSMNNADEIKEHLEILKKCIKLAHKLNVRMIRGFTFWNEGGFDLQLSGIISRFEDAVKLLHKEGMTLVLESDPSVYASNAVKLGRVVKGLDAACVKALWDPGNDLYDPDCEIPFPDGYNAIKSHMVHMHLKDAARLPNGKTEGRPIGEGQVDYKGQFADLIKDGYNGYVVLETHYRHQHNISDDLLLLPKGSAFSYGGQEATEECLEKWFKLLDSL